MENKCYSHSTVVTDAMTAKALGSGGIAVLSTPYMIAMMEGAAVGCAAELLPEGKTSVGVEISVKHLAATPVGMKMTAHAELTGQEGRIMTFRIWAEDECGLIGEGTHTRAMVDEERFLQKIYAKGAPNAQ